MNHTAFPFHVAPTFGEQGREAFNALSRRFGTALRQTRNSFDAFQVLPAVRPAVKLLGSAAVVAASSAAFAATITAPLAAISSAQAASTSLYSSIPWAGAFMFQMLGQAGALGALATAAPLLGLALTFVQADGTASDHLHWLMTHIAIGFSVSPLWILPAAQVMGALPVAALACGCLAGVSALLNVRLEQKQASAHMLVVGVMLVLGGAPLPALLATGVSVGAAASLSALTLAGGATGLALWTLYRNFAALSDDSTAALRALAVRTDLSAWRLNLLGEPDPTVICGNQELLDHVTFLRQEQAARRRLGVRKILLSGAPGVGKTAISRSMGHALGAKTYLISPSRILAAPNPAQEMRSLFAQAKTLGGRAIFFFDDAEVLFGDRKSTRNLAGGFDALTLMTTTLNDCLDGIERDAYDMLLVVLSTNNRSYLDDSIRQRFGSCDVEIAPPDRAFFREQLRLNYRRARQEQHARLGGRMGATARVVQQLIAIPDAVLDVIATKAYAESSKETSPLFIVGRDMEQLCDKVLQDLSVRQQVRRNQVPKEAQLLEAFERQWDVILRGVRQRAEDSHRAALLAAQV